MFLPSVAGDLARRSDGLLPTTLVADDDLRRAVAGAEVVHSIAREWVGALERAARWAGAAFVETPLVHRAMPSRAIAEQTSRATGATTR